MRQNKREADQRAQPVSVSFPPKGLLQVYLSPPKGHLQVYLNPPKGHLQVLTKKGGKVHNLGEKRAEDYSNRE
jgi:hypothetical protein